jgi:hypothetical protein
MNNSDLSSMFPKPLDDATGHLWDQAETAPDNTPLPKGTYNALIIKGALCESRSGTRGYRITFRVEEGEHTGQMFWHTVWLSEKAITYAKRDLRKLGITSTTELAAPYPPPGMLVHAKATLVLHKEDDGTERNEVRHFEILSHDEAPKDEFAPRHDELAGGDSQP